MAGKKERQRKLAREHMLRQQARRSQQARRARQTSIIVVICLVVAGLGVGGYFLFSQPATSSSAAASATAPASASALASAAATASAAPVAEPAKSCTYTTSRRRPATSACRRQARPEGHLPGHDQHQPRRRGHRPAEHKATCTVNSFVYLAAKSYFSNTICHRLPPAARFTCSSAATRPGPEPAARATSSTARTWPGPSTPRAPWRWRHRAAGFQRQPVLPRLQELDPGAELYAVRHGRQRAREHPECGQGGDCERQGHRGWASEGESRHRGRDHHEDLSQARRPGQDRAGG